MIAKLQLAILRMVLIMHNNVYIKQIFEEGLATTFYQKPKKYIERKLNNEIIKKTFHICLTILYIIFIVIISVIIFKFNFPL